MKIIPMILSGGAGSRLWPVSREMHPKPFIKLNDGQSLLQKAFLRGAALPSVSQVVTVTNRESFFQTKDEYAEINVQGLPNTYVLEPFGRNTAAAIAAAATQIKVNQQEEALMLVLAADHLISDQAAFSAAVARAATLAESGKLVTFGIQPTSAETGYGYIEAKGEDVVRFVEKPSLKKAEAYLASGDYLWNSGMFCFSVDTILKEMERHCPQILSATRECLTESRQISAEGLTQVELDAKLFESVPSESIDYAVMEKSDNIAVVPCSIGWSDIGSWGALGELVSSDEQGNRVEGDVLLHNTQDCYIKSKSRLTATVGVKNLVIVDTQDALLVADKSNAQDVKYLYEALKKQGRQEYKLHRTVHRPWGTYTLLEEGPRFKIKRIVVKPGASLSLQMHYHRNEHWIVVSGTAKVVNGDDEFLVATNESTYIPSGHKHRLENPGVLDLILIEVQSGDYLGEDDIVRFDDHYGRA